MEPHCCEQMRNQVELRCPEHPDRYLCGDALVVYTGKFREYGLIVHDGGQSSVQIDYCPWCGARLPSSVRDRWFEAIEALGIDPFTEDVPGDFNDETWLRDLDVS